MSSTESCDGTRRFKPHVSHLWGGENEGLCHKEFANIELISRTSYQGSGGHHPLPSRGAERSWKVIVKGLKMEECMIGVITSLSAHRNGRNDARTHQHHDPSDPPLSLLFSLISYSRVNDITYWQVSSTHRQAHILQGPSGLVLFPKTGNK